MVRNSSGSKRTNAVDLKLVATSSPDSQTRLGPVKPGILPSTNYFKSAHWTADGTCVITNSNDNYIRTYIIPPELLDERVEPLQLHPYTEISSAEPADAIVSYPGFNLQDTATALVLSTVNDHPIRLHSAVTSGLVASYPLINSTTEAYIKPNSLTFNLDGSQFIAGSESLISTFDLSTPGQDPVSSTLTGPKNNKSTRKRSENSMRGIVSALTLDRRHNILAAGTLSRHVGLYDMSAFDKCVGVFSLPTTDVSTRVGGRGVTQLLWSPCGTYLYIAERKSNGALVYDIRNTGQLLSWLHGRQADTNQRMNMDISATGNSGQHEIWAGGTDGAVRVWRDPYQSEGCVTPTSEYFTHNDAVSSPVLHPSGSVLATVSGQRRLDGHESGSTDSTDMSLKLWSLVADKGTSLTTGP